MEKEYTLEELQKMQGEDEGFTLEQLQAMNQDEPLGPVGTFAASAGDVLSAGYGPNILAGIKTGSLSNQEYIAERDKLNQLLEQSKEENPKSAIAGTGAGIVAGMALPAPRALQTGSLLVKMLKGAVTGSTVGALSDTPDIEGELNPVDAKKRIKQAEFGGVIGSAAPVLAEIIPSSVERGFQSLGPRKRDVLKTMRGGPSKQEIASYGFRKKIIGFGNDVQEMYTKAMDDLEKVGSELGAIYQKASKIAQNKQHQAGSEGIQYQLSRNSINGIASKIEKKINDDLGLEVGIDKVKAQIMDYLNQVDQITSQQGFVPDILDLHQVKQKLAKMANYSKNAVKTGSEIPANQEAWSLAERIVADEIDNVMNGLSKDAPELAGELKRLNKEYSLSSTIKNILEDRAAGDQAVNRGFGIQEFINETLQPRVNSSLGKIANIAEKITPNILKPNEAMSPVMAPLLMQNVNQSPLQRYKSGQ